MAKTLEFNYKGIDYTLEFTRRTVKKMEADGFVVGEIADKPMTLLPELFAGAFKAHHKNTKIETIEEIFSKLPDKKEKLLPALAAMYNEPFETLMSEPDENAENVEWVTSW